MNEITEKYKRMIERFECDFLCEMERPYFYSMSELLKSKNKKLLKDIDLLRELSFGLRCDNLKIIETDKRKKEDIISELFELGYTLKEEKDSKMIFIKDKIEFFINTKEKYFFKEKTNGSKTSEIITLQELKIINQFFEKLEEEEKE